MKYGKLILKLSFSVISVGFLGYVLLVSFLLFGPKVSSYLDQVSFDSYQWKAHLADRDPIKLKMVDSLLVQHKLIGLHIIEVEELLGKPPRTDYFKDYDYVYWLGPERSIFGIDSEWLGIKFQNDIVVKVDILKD